MEVVTGVDVVQRLYHNIEYAERLDTQIDELRKERHLALQRIALLEQAALEDHLTARPPIIAPLFLAPAPAPHRATIPFPRMGHGLLTALGAIAALLAMTAF